MNVRVYLKNGERLSFYLYMRRCGRYHEMLIVNIVLTRHVYVTKSCQHQVVLT
jgi:hypothetical protein